MRRLALGVERRRPVIAFDDGHRAAGEELLFQHGERPLRRGQMLHHEAHEDVVKRRRRERQVEEVGLLERHVRQARRLHAFVGAAQRAFGDVNGRDARLRALPRERHRLRPDAAARLQHAAAGGIGGVGVQQFAKRGGLILKPQALRRSIAVDVRVVHGGVST